MVKPLRKIVLLLACAGLNACGGSSYLFDEEDSAPSGYRDLSNVPDAIPREEAPSRYGNPASYKVFGKRYHVMQDSAGYTKKGIASWYGTKFHGRKTSSGERYDMYAMTAAHKSLPLPTYVEVTNLNNGRKVIVKVNDRGPFHNNRIIDLSYAAAHRLGILGKGTGFVEIRAIDPSQPTPDTETVLAARDETPPHEANEANDETADKAISMYLQVGAFLSRDNAERLRHKLLDAAFGNTQISPVEQNGNTVYRVRLGPILDTNSADQLVGKLVSLGIHNSHVVSD
ncbi:septal ring lytic transglycosylase RlpA family protein [Sulfuriflexus mobilis]|uniref:septal ring lytic transglycosylase RlpA family protein n=1 Tax=Sulfuriflexus mobilis TaxID=1811807 RepID=UPI000F83233E|nr:septal ring lytic transglycosylase RlpA family protein [Sulfuriflexus mobilis]